MAELPQSQGITALPLKPETRAHIAAQSIVQVIVFIVVGARLFSRKFLGAGLGLDDLMITFATLMSCGVYGTIVALQSAGAGYKQAEAAHNLPTILLMTFILVPFYLACLLFSKISMLCFYLRIFEQHSLRLWSLGTMAICIVWFIGHLLTNVFACNPVEAQWKMELIMTGKGTCINQIPLFQSMIISNMFTDLIIMALPLKTIWRLQMRTMEKLGVMASFLLLGAVIVVGSVRVHYVSTVNLRADLTRTMPISLLLTTLEPNFAILCVSIPMLRPLYRSYRARFGSSRGATKLSDDPIATIGGSGAPQSNKQRQGRDDIALFTFDNNKQTKFTTTNDGGSAQSLESEASGRKLTSVGMNTV